LTTFPLVLKVNNETIDNQDKIMITKIQVPKDYFINVGVQLLPPTLHSYLPLLLTYYDGNQDGNVSYVEFIEELMKKTNYLL
jgi:hypothetical protein